jgi:hypothetical protein
MYIHTYIPTYLPTSYKYVWIVCRVHSNELHVTFVRVTLLIAGTLEIISARPDPDLPGRWFPLRQGFQIPGLCKQRC